MGHEGDGAGGSKRRGGKGFGGGDQTLLVSILCPDPREDEALVIVKNRLLEITSPLNVMSLFDSLKREKFIPDLCGEMPEG